METLGASLRHAREKQNMALEELARRTCISRGILRALEADTVDQLPPPSYVRGFLRICARELDVDSQSFIDLYEQDRQVSEQVNARHRHSASHQKRAFAAPVYALLFLIVLVPGIVCLMVTQRQAEPDTTNKKATAEPLPAATASLPSSAAPRVPVSVAAPVAAEETAPGQASPDAGEQDAAAGDTAFTLRVVARELTWIRISVDGGEPFEIMLRSGESYRQAAVENMRLRIGNAGGLVLFYNEIPLGVPGEQGKPLNLNFPQDAERLQLFD